MHWPLCAKADIPFCGRRTKSTGGMTEAQLWGTANEYLRLYGYDAKIFAAQRADELLEQGDYDGMRHWCDVVERIGVLLERPYGPLN